MLDRSTTTLEAQLLAMFEGYGSGSIVVWPRGVCGTGHLFCVYLHDARDESVCACGWGDAVAEALAGAKRDLKSKTDARGDLPEPCSHCGAITKADIEFLCTSHNRAHLDAGEPCHGESP